MDAKIIKSKFGILTAVNTDPKIIRTNFWPDRNSNPRPLRREAVLNHLCHAIGLHNISKSFHNRKKIDTLFR